MESEQEKNRRKLAKLLGLGGTSDPITPLPDINVIEKLLALGKAMDEFEHQTLTPPPKEVNPKFSLFYGFNGILAKQYSVIEDKTEDEIRARMLMLKLKTPLAWSIHRWEEFKKIVEQFANTPNALSEIPFDDAMSIIRVGQLNEFEKFIEAEQEEFTDKCILGKCRPGNHFCGN